MICKDKKDYIKKLYLIHGNNMPYKFADVSDDYYDQLFVGWWVDVVPHEYVNYIQRFTGRTVSLTEEGLLWLMS